MIKLAMTPDGDEFHVWVMLDDPDHNDNPTERGESFIVGSGVTKLQALLNAKLALDRAAGDVLVLMREEARRD